MPRQLSRNDDLRAPSARLVPGPRSPLVDQQVSVPATKQEPARSRWYRRQPWTRLAALIIFCDLAAAGATAAFSRSPAWCLLMGCMVMAAIRHSGLQRRRLAPRLLDDLPTLLSLALVGLGAVLLLRGILHHTGGTNSVRDAAHLMAFLILFRLAMYTVVRWGRQRGYFLHNTLFIGHGKLGQVLSETLRDDRRYGLLPVGFVGDRPGESVTLPRLGALSAVPELVRKHSIDAVVIADVEGFEERLTAATRSFDGKGVAVLLVPRLWELHGSVGGCEMVRGIPLVRLRRPAYESLTWPLKRALDLAVSTVALILLSPLLLACAVLVRREAGPGIIFRQQRMGRSGQLFDLYKFRSLRAASGEEEATRWCVAGDDRVGPVGRWMRKLSLDELPQLINVLKGNMSLVGPRPERPYFVAKFSSEFGEYADRHRVPCGLTGWAQIHGLRGDTSVATRARYDNYYIENWSLWLDVKILLQTVRQVVVGGGS
jgi:exopolysaccharide biosynthesis polyprenyl glycosylphosphotransferase